jgi:glycosyltransferase involved in cell wall biosynthesis
MSKSESEAPFGGTERVVSYLTEELVRQGHNVTLFASGDSKTSAELVRCCDVALRLNPVVVDPTPYHVIMLEEVRQRADTFDIIHFHIDFLHCPLVRDFAQRTVTTLHGRLDLPHIVPFYTVFQEFPLVAISGDQRKYLRAVNWAGTVHHGLPRDLLPFQPKASGGYLAFLGRIAPEKRPDNAIEIAAKTGMSLKIAAKVDRVDQTYWEEKIGPMVKAHANVEFVGEIAEHEKASFLGQASALLFPVDWPEPFGLVMIEPMACGTPVIALNRGSVGEVIEPEVSGFIVDTIDQAVAAVEQAANMDRAKVRAAFERHFTAERMARDYLNIYQALAARFATPMRRSRKTSRLSIANRVLGQSDFIIEPPAYRRREIAERGQTRRRSRLGTEPPTKDLQSPETTPPDDPGGAS